MPSNLWMSAVSCLYVIGMVPCLGLFTYYGFLRSKIHRDINVKIPPGWYSLYAIPSPMWDLQYYLQIAQYLDDLNPTSVVPTVDLPPIFLLTN